MEPKNFQEIFNNILGYLPKKWKKVALYFAFSGNMVSHKFYVDCGKGYIDCFQMGYDKAILRQIFFSIEDILINERESLPEGNVWNVFTMFISASGKFDTNYDYTDLSETFIDYQDNWEKNYIFNTEKL